MHPLFLQLSLVALDSARVTSATGRAPMSVGWRVVVGTLTLVGVAVVGWKLWREKGATQEGGPADEAGAADAPIDRELAKSLRFSKLPRRHSVPTAAPEANGAGAPPAETAPEPPPSTPRLSPRPAPVSAANALKWEMMSEEEREEFITALGQSIAARKEEVDTEVQRRVNGELHLYVADAHCPECGSAIDDELLRIGRITCPGCGCGIAVYVVPESTGTQGAMTPGALVVETRDETPRANEAVGQG